VQWLGHLLPPVSDLLEGFMCVCAQVSCSVVSNWPFCDFCGRVYCDILSIFLIPQFCLFLRHQTMDKVQKHNSFKQCLSLWPTQPAIQRVLGVLSPGLKQPGPEADHSPPSSAEVKDARSIPPLIQYVFLVWCLIKQLTSFHGVVLN
jgi:hypothetical protein